MELKDYIKKPDEGSIDEVIPKIRKKREKLPATPEQIKEPVPEMTDDECLQFYVDLSNMAYMGINNKLRPLDIQEVEPVKHSAGNVIRTIMKYLGDYKFYLDVAVMSGFTIGLYKQRKAELNTDKKEDKIEIKAG